ncbi:MAG TPA: LysM domain-containing protein, partial [Bacteroidales bacterium]|nr:LysM domain-containing protein [Bacteroidales bacterium]
KKKNQAQKPHFTHTIQKNETLFSVSQLYGVKISKLATMNRRNPDENIPEGTHIYVRKNLIMFE